MNEHIYIVYPLMNINKKGELGGVRKHLKTLQGPADLDYDDLARLKMKYYRMNMEDDLKHKVKTNHRTHKINTETNQPYDYLQGKLSKSIKLHPLGSEQHAEKVKVRRSLGKKRAHMTEQEKKSKLQSFFEHTEELIDQWRNKEKTQKVKFKSKMKLAAISPSKSQKKLTKKDELKHSLKNIHARDVKMYLPAALQNIRSERLLEVQKVKLPQQKVKTVQSELIKNHLETILIQMEKNKKELLKDKKQILKQLKVSQKKQQQQSKMLLIKQIEEDYQRDQLNMKEERMERYRRELELELEKELSFQKLQEDSARKDKQEMKQSRVNVQEQKSIKKEEYKLNPEKVLPPKSKYINLVGIRSHSLIETHRRNDTQPLKKITNLTETQRERCNKIIQKYSTRQPSPLNKKIQNKPRA